MTKTVISEKLANPRTNLDSQPIVKELEATDKSAVLATEFDKVSAEYEIPIDQSYDIRDFLKQHRFLYPILKEARPQITSIFGNEVKIYLDLHSDPEEGWDELFVVIRSSYSPEEAVRLENKLFQKWFLDRINDTRGKLNIIEEPL